MRAIRIDPFAGKVEEIDTPTDWRSLQSVVGGSVDVAHAFPNGDVLYVNDDGIAMSERSLEGDADAGHSAWFDLGLHQPFAGVGVMVGAEDGEGVHGDALTPLAAVERRARFMVPASAAAEPGPSGAN